MKKEKKQYPPVHAYIPVGMPDLEKLMAGTGLKPDRGRALFHQLYMSRLQDSANKRTIKSDRYKNGFVLLNAELLRKLVTSKYKKYINFFERAGLLIVRRSEETGGISYSKNGLSAQYKIPENLLKGSGIEHFKKQEIKDYAVLKAIYRTKAAFRNRAINGKHLLFSPIHQAMAIMLKDVRFNVSSASEYLEGILKGSITVKPTKSGEERDYRSMYQLMVAINDGEQFNQYVDGFGFRYHTFFTSLWSPLRRFIFFNDTPEMPLVNLDITNSQAYFSSCFNDNVIKKLLPEFVPIITHVAKYTEDESYKRYASLCASGEIYTYWAKLRGIERDAAKAEMFYILFSSNRRNTKKEVAMKEPKRAFAKEFPAVYDCFKTIKSLTDKDLPLLRDVLMNENGVLKGNHNYKFMSAAMQRAESGLIIGRIAPKLIEKRIKFISIHDSFLVKEVDAPMVKTIMEAEFKALGIQPPQIKEEILK